MNRDVTSSLISISAHLLNLASDSSDNLISLYGDDIFSQAWTFLINSLSDL